MHQLLGQPKPISESTPVSAGVSCLAALPSEVRDLVPDPYRQLDIDDVEIFYGQCMNPVDNVFDMKKFERLCDERVAQLGLEARQGREANTKSKMKQQDVVKRIDQSHYWVILSKSSRPSKNPIDPPPPFSDRLTRLKPNKLIRVHRTKAHWEPRNRGVWKDTVRVIRSNNRRKKIPEDQDSINMLKQSEPDEFLSRFESINRIAYKDAYESFQKRKKKSQKVAAKSLKMTLTSSSVKVMSNGEATPGSSAERKRRKRRSEDENVDVSILDRSPYTPVPKDFARTKDGQSALACLKQLQDAGLIGSIDWAYTLPSKSVYASFNPQEHEHILLTVSKSENRELNALGDDFLEYEQDREINRVSKKDLKQHLATFAISEIAGPKVRWSELTFKELKEAIASLANGNVRSETKK